ncbi:MAG: Capsule polysaccharide biosynthesis protein [Methanosaeta sp. PtaU1.Bin060]|nr:MAG: Capsule polysaccharide biosynthesis protein [Methanosaeta sp. PtaU1.Bin060]
MTQKETILFSQMDLTDSINTIKYVEEFKKDFNVVYSTFAESELLYNAAARSGISLHHIPFLKDTEVPTNRAEIDDKLQSIEQEVGMPLEKVFFGDREFYRIYKKNELTCLAWFIKVWERFRKIIEENDVMHHFCFGEDRLHDLVPYYLIKNRGGRSYLVRIVPYYGVTYTNDFFGRFTHDYNIKINKANFEDYKKHIKENKVYFNPATINRIDYYKYANAGRLFRRLQEIEKINWQDKDNIYKDHNIKLLPILTKKLWSNGIKGRLTKALAYGQIDEDQRYIYYPFHFTDDAQVRLKYPEGYNQYELIRNIARNIPVSFKLLVKEHPAYVGKYSIGELHDLSKLPNIVVIDPKISSKDIFNYSDYVITINSTVGYEALFYDKIVITMGNSFYDDFPGVIKIRDVSELYKILTDDGLISCKREELSRGLKEKTIALLESTLQYDYYHFYDEDNIKKMKDLLLIYINDQRKK